MQAFIRDFIQALLFAFTIACPFIAYFLIYGA